MNHNASPLKRSTRLQLNYLYSGRVQYIPGDVLVERNLSDFEFVHILQGSPQYIINGKKFFLKKSSILCGKPGCIEEYIWDTQDVTIHSYFHFSIRSFPHDFLPLKKWPLVLTDPPRLLGSIMETIVNKGINHKFTDQSPGTSITRLVESLIDLYLSPDASFVQAESEQPFPIQQALLLMRNAIDYQTCHEITLDKLAKAASVHKQHLCKLFQTNFALSPMQTLRLMQLQLSMGLLIRSGLSIKEIAQRCGFEDALYFSRYFKKQLGSSPSEVKKAVRTGKPPPEVPLPQGISPARLHW